MAGAVKLWDTAPAVSLALRSAEGPLSREPSRAILKGPPGLTPLVCSVSK